MMMRGRVPVAVSSIVAAAIIAAVALSSGRRCRPVSVLTNFKFCGLADAAVV
jgi:hypothetical protein